MKRFFPASVFAVLGVFAVVPMLIGCDTNAPAASSSPTALAPSDTAPPLLPSPAPQTGIAGDKPVEGAGRTVTVYSIIEDADGNRSLKAKTVPLPSGSVSSPATFALESLMNTAHSPIPAGTKLHGIKIADGVATVDFSGEFKIGFPGGDSAEAIVINSIVTTLGQFSSVKSVQILVDGAKIDSLGGNLSLDEPIPVQAATSTDKDVPKGGG